MPESWVFRGSFEFVLCLVIMLQCFAKKKAEFELSEPISKALFELSEPMSKAEFEPTERERERERENENFIRGGLY